jgi:hypothetical protein
MARPFSNDCAEDCLFNRHVLSLHSAGVNEYVLVLPPGTSVGKQVHDKVLHNRINSPREQ